MAGSADAQLISEAELASGLLGRFRGIRGIDYVAPSGSSYRWNGSVLVNDGTPISLTAAQIASPTAAILADTTAAYIGPDGVRYSSTGIRLRSASGGVTTAVASSSGFTGPCGPDNFGMIWISTPLNFDAVVGAAALTRNDLSARLSGTESTGWVRVFWNFDTSGGNDGLFGAGTAVINATRLTDLKYLLDFWKAKSKKVLLVIPVPLTGVLADLNLYRDRLRELLWNTYYGQAPEGTQQIDAIQCGNELFSAFVGIGFNDQVAIGVRTAEIMRVSYKQIKAFSKTTLVVAGSFQGGEGLLIQYFLQGSAASSCVVQNDGGGTGTRGEQFFDVLSFHPYDISDTKALADLNFTKSQTAVQIKAYTDIVWTSIATRRASVGDGGAAFWAGRPDPELWATEVNVSFNGAALANSAQFILATAHYQTRQVQLLIYQVQFTQQIHIR